MIAASVLTLLLAATDAEQATTFIRKALESYTPNAKDPAPNAYADSFKTLMERDQQGAEGIGVLDSDPICDCQDWDTIIVKSVKAGKPSGHRIPVDATFTNGGHTSTSRFIVEVGEQGPRIWDIIRNPKEGSIRRALEKAIAERASAAKR